MNYDFFISIVVFNPDIKILFNCISDLLGKKNIYISIFDNSKLLNVQKFCKNNNIKYLGNKKNVGFGKGHNENIKIFNFENKSKYIVIMNPDIFLKYYHLHKIIEVYSMKKNIGIVSPQLLNKDGSIQHSVRCFPGFFSFFISFFGFYVNYSKKIKGLIQVPCLHGALYVLKPNVFFKIKGFDEQYFLYCEDIDLCSKTCNLGLKNIIHTGVQVTHLHQKESHKNLLLFLIHIISVIKYLLKWRVGKYSKLDEANSSFLKNFK